MATKRITLLTGLIVPDEAGGVGIERVDTNFFTTDIYPHLLVRFSDAGEAARYLYGSRSLPADIVSSVEVETVWSSPATSGTLDMDFGYRVVTGDDSESFAITTEEQAINATDVVSGTARRRQILTFTSLTAANFHADATLKWRLSRDSAGGSDIADNIFIFDVRLKYDDA